MKNLLLLFLISFAVQCTKTDEYNKGINYVPNKEIDQKIQAGAIDIFKQSVQTEPSDKNVIISPLSIQYAVGMAANGASGATLDELMRVYQASPGEINAINTQLKDFATYMRTSSDGYKVKISNGVFYDPGKFQMALAYKTSLSDFYTPVMEELDFEQKQPALDKINNWVADQTEQKIKKVLDDIRQEEFMFLINALYMKADWDQPFSPEITATGQFTQTAGAAVNAEYMNQRNNISYYKSENEKAVILPMAKNRLAAMFIIPQKVDILNYIAGLKAENLETIKSGAESTDLMIRLPKLESLLHYDLKTILQDMGITTPFSDHADFTGMGTASDNILLTRALHDVFMKMDEKGLEGAAVTTIGVGVVSMPETVSFDKPFVMAVYDTKTGNYLFLGKVEKP